MSSFSIYSHLNNLHNVCGYQLNTNNFSSNGLTLLVFKFFIALTFKKSQVWSSSSYNGTIILTIYKNLSNIKWNYLDQLIQCKKNNILLL